MPSRIGKVQIVPAGAGKLSVQIEAVADIDHNQKGWPDFGHWQAPDSVLSLTFDAQHRIFPDSGASLGQRRREVMIVERIGTELILLGFQQEAPLFVQIERTQFAAIVAR
ncbi:MAG: hypothetical protein FWD57_03435 [Polyangiaceae bacterium]|nr:hypothetical protein [Polyangiaceae bacterium]